MRKITSWGWVWIDQNGHQYAAQVGHDWNGEYLTVQDRRILRRLARA